MREHPNRPTHSPSHRPANQTHLWVSLWKINPVPPWSVPQQSVTTYGPPCRKISTIWPKTYYLSRHLYRPPQFDQLEASVKSVRKVGFTLLDCVRINSQMFEMVNVLKAPFFGSLSHTIIVLYAFFSYSHISARCLWTLCKNQLLD